MFHACARALDVLKELKLFATNRTEELSNKPRPSKNKSITSLVSHITIYPKNLHPDPAVGLLPSHADHIIPAMLLEQPVYSRDAHDMTEDDAENEPSRPPNYRPVSSILAGNIQGK